MRRAPKQLRTASEHSSSKLPSSCQKHCRAASRRFYFLYKNFFSNRLRRAPKQLRTASEHSSSKLPSSCQKHCRAAPRRFIFYIKTKFLNRFETRSQATPNCFRAQLQQASAAAKNTAEQLPADFIFYIKTKFLTASRRAPKQLRTASQNSELLRVGGAQELRATPSYSEPFRASNRAYQAPWKSRKLDTPSFFELRALQTAPSYSERPLQTRLLELSKLSQQLFRAAF